jgi:hypothetical protein
MLGCEVYGSESGFLTEPCLNSITELEHMRLNRANAWLDKYMEFTEQLVAFSSGRFPVGQPIMRGQSDIVGALVGQGDMVLMMNDYPDEMRGVLQRIADIFKAVIFSQQEKIPAYHSGSSIGFYHLWAPGKSIWFQEDLSALYSPQYYRRFLKNVDASICRDYDYSLIHLHPSSFFVIDDLLEIDSLSVIEINKDVGGPSVEEMLPVMLKTHAKKNLAVWGELSKKDIDIILDGLPDHRVHLSILVPSVDRARSLMDHVQSRAT